jgi:SAM-dependent methyltransferase
MTQTTSESTYALSNQQRGAGTSLSWLAQVLDLTTMTILKPLIPVGGRCIELGAGAGTIARWMADRAGSGGLVIATDLDPQHLPTHPGVRPIRHDLRTDPLSDLGIEEPDVIHARCLLAHLHNRDTLVGELVDLLRPGGDLVIEDMGGSSLPGQVLYSPFDNTADLYEIYQHSLVKMFRANGNDTTWASRTHAVMTHAGLQEVRTVVSARSWHGGTAGCRLPATLSTQVEDQLIQHGATAAHLAELRLHLADPRVVILGNPTWSTVGRKSMEG